MLRHLNERLKEEEAFSVISKRETPITEAKTEEEEREGEREGEGTGGGKRRKGWRENVKWKESKRCYQKNKVKILRKKMIKMRNKRRLLSERKENRRY